MPEAKIIYKKIDPKAMFMHTELAKGEFGDDVYRFIKDVGNKAFILEYKGEKYRVDTFDFVKGLLEAVEK